jgi:hypothetical protein
MMGGVRTSSRDRPIPLSGAERMRRVLALAGCGFLSVTVSACESTEQESAKIGREGQQLSASQGALRLGAVNHSVKVSDVTLLNNAGRTAVAVRLTGTSTRPQVNVPVLVDVTTAGGRLLYSNETGGLEASLQRMGLLRPSQSEWWVDDQVADSQSSARVKVKVGTGTSPHPGSPLPALETTGVRLSYQDGLSTLTGELVNHSGAAQSGVPVFAVALRAGKVLAAGRALVNVPSGRSGAVPFQIFMVGDPAGASLQLTVAPMVG